MYLFYIGGTHHVISHMRNDDLARVK